MIPALLFSEHKPHNPAGVRQPTRIGAHVILPALAVILVGGPFADAAFAQKVQDAPMKRAELVSGSTGLANRYYRERKYDLARIEYEKVLEGLARKKQDDDDVRARLGLTLMRRGEYREGRRLLSTGRNFPSLYLSMFAAMKTGVTYQAFLRQKTIESGADFTDRQKDLSSLLIGTLYLESGNYDRARTFYRKLRKETEEELIQRKATEVLLAVDKYREVPRKSMFLAGLFSALLPGAGQIYSGHDADGITAFLFNGLFIGAASALYHLENRAETGHGASIFFGFVGLVFYISNITGAMASAKRYNIYQERSFQQRIRNRFLNLNFLERTSGISFQSNF